MSDKSKQVQETNMDTLMHEIREVTKKQKSASRVDEVRVMRTMLNDPDFAIGIYDRNKGYIGQRSPREEAVKFISSVTASITGLDAKSTEELAQNYEFTKRDATFLIENSRDFVQTYLQTGRKLPIVQGVDSEASLINRPVAAKEKIVPDGNTTKSTLVPAHNKVICKSKCPKYIV